ncbi:MAG: hypothetical protein ABI434_20870, partial [Burkholderiaceae bacterium]
ITLWSLVYLVVLILLLLWFAARLQHWLSDGPLLRDRMDPGVRQAAGALVSPLAAMPGTQLRS